jgi:transposase-like protein
MQDTNSQLGCKLCGSTNLVKFGRYRGIQRWWCKDCRHKFADNDAVSKMKTPAEEVASAIDMYFAGVPLHNIPKLLFRRYGAFISYTSVYRWIVRFSQLAVEKCEDSQLNVGNTWLIMESSTRNDIKDIKLSFLDIVDASTGFLLATRISYCRSQYDIKALVEQARKKAGKVPSKVLTDGWRGYVNGIRLALGGTTGEIQVLPFNGTECPEVVKIWQQAAGARSKIITGFKKESTTLIMLNGWYMHYNYFNPNGALAGMTPAAAAGAGYHYRNWLEIVRQPRV